MLRIIAAFGIVAYHTGVAGTEVWYAGLIVFLVLTPLVDLSFNWERLRSPRALAKRILGPWLFWWSVYGLINLAKHKPLAPVPGLAGLVLYGTAGHLWFMPAIFIALLGTNQLKRGSPRLAFGLAALMTVVLLGSAVLWRPASLSWQPPFVQWIDALPAVTLGIALGVVRFVPRGIIAASAASLLIALLVLSFQRLRGFSEPYLVGSGLVLASMALARMVRLRLPDVQPIASCMLGVYLCHLLVLGVVKHVLGEHSFPTAVGTFLVALTFVWLLQRSLPISQLIIGPPVRQPELLPVPRTPG